MSTVFVVEDDLSVGDVVEELLREEGHTVVRAMNGQEALDQLVAGNVPDAILLDLMMPVLNGHQLLAIMQEHPVWRDIPVIVASANSAPRLPVRAFLQKPYGVGELLTTLRRIVHASKRRSVG